MPKAEYKYPIGFIQGFQGAPFFLTWDLDKIYDAEKPNDDRLSKNPYSKFIVVSSKRPKNFRYVVHNLVSRYFKYEKVHTTDISLDVN